MKKYIYLIFAILCFAAFNASASSVQPFVDLLAWRAYESNASWATILSFPSNTTNFTPNYINFNTRLGMKAGLMYSPENNFWDSKLYWTYFPTNTSSSIPVAAHVVTPIFFSGSTLISGDAYLGGSVNWDLTMNMIDLEISHGFKPLPSFTLTPKIGIKGGSINQNINANWNAVILVATENVTNDFTGMGPSFGLDGKWNFYGDFSVVGDISSAVMYGRWNVKDTYKRPAALLGIIPAQTIVTSMNQSKLGTFMMDYYFGLQWIHQNKSRVTVQLGYEMQYWANQLRIVTINQLPTFGDLTIEGATCGISIDL